MNLQLIINYLLINLIILIFFFYHYLKQNMNIQNDEDKIESAINHIKYLNLVISGLMRLEKQKTQQRKIYKNLLEKTKTNLSKLLKDIVVKEQRQSRVIIPKDYLKQSLTEIEKESNICFEQNGQGIRFSFHKRQKQTGKYQYQLIIDLYTIRDNEIKVNVLHKKLKNYVLKMYADSITRQNQVSRQKDNNLLKKKIFLQGIQQVRKQYFKRLRYLLDGTIKCSYCDMHMKYDQKQNTFLPPFLTQTKEFRVDPKQTNPKFYHQKCYEDKPYFL